MFDRDRLRLCPARALLWLLRGLYRAKDEDLSWMLDDAAQSYARRPRGVA